MMTVGDRLRREGFQVFQSPGNVSGEEIEVQGGMSRHRSGRRIFNEFGPVKWMSSAIVAVTPPPRAPPPQQKMQIHSTSSSQATPPTSPSAQKPHSLISQVKLKADCLNLRHQWNSGWTKSQTSNGSTTGTAAHGLSTQTSYKVCHGGVEGVACDEGTGHSEVSRTQTPTTPKHENRRWIRRRGCEVD
ncbi:hypothetical protein BDN72DRAFT_438434 [Pluteus cervinus]|uniref:Uncharacterized protein n=1 Tax=Pluteus cervinus TaxID=181527 RepID=A0ACD3A763_9AGAR|nr:hypothetical protein BDN72DRAFT_438434 [Pluteus cervinus]